MQFERPSPKHRDYRGHVQHHEIKEHTEIERLLKQFEDVDPDDPRSINCSVRSPKNVRHHVQEEETHYAANLMGVTPKSMWPAVKAMLHSVYDQPDQPAVHAQFDRLLAYVDDKLPEVHEHLDTARADILAFTGFPKDMWTQIWSIFPNRDAIVRLVGAVLAEQTDEWAEGRRYLGLEALARCRMNIVTTTEPEIGAETLPALTA